MKILLVDDEKSLCKAIELMLQRAGFEFVAVQNGALALSVFEEENPDLVILDVMLPGLDGFELCEELRKKSPRLPILMLSAKNDVIDKRIGFKAGADDYMAKPFDEEELLLRIEALLRRSNAGSYGNKQEAAQTSRPSTKEAILFEDAAEGTSSLSVQSRRRIPDDLIIDTARRELIVRGEPVKLTPKEFQILELLASQPGAVFTREEIIDVIWGVDYQGSGISIPTFIKHIREKIEEDISDPKILQTVFGFGYRLGD